MGIPSDAVLSRKLRELESTLREAFATRRSETEEKSAEVESKTEDEISRRIEFLRNLLCAEMESHVGSTPIHLYHIVERLALLEAAYQRWVDGGSSLEEGDGFDDASTCSCTFSCFNEEEEEIQQESPPPDDPRPIEAHVASLESENPGSNFSGEPDKLVGPQSKRGFPARVVALITATAVAIATGILVNSFMEAERTILLAPT